MVTVTKSQTSPNRSDIEALVAFLPRLRQADFGGVEKWRTRNADGSLCLPHPVYQTWVQDFVDCASSKCWRDASYDPAIAGEMLDDDELLRRASLDQIKALLTYFVRGERFCDGLQAEMIRRGEILAIVLRLEELLREFR